jgi:hypothetical protein
MKNRSKILMAILPVLACFALLPGARAQNDEGDIPGTGDTQEGFQALFNVDTSVTGFDTGLGWVSLWNNVGDFFNTGVGAGTLFNNSGANDNTAVGAATMFFNTTGGDNTAVGINALRGDPTVFNTGSFNNAIGSAALFSNQTGDGNEAIGNNALTSNTTGSWNVASGHSAMFFNTAGMFNTAVGNGAGNNLSVGSENIYIGDTAGSLDFTGAAPGDESGVIRIGSFFAGTTACYINGILPNFIPQASGNPLVTINTTTGQLGWTTDFAASKVVEQEKKIEEQQASIIQLKTEMQTMVAQLKEQAAQIQRVSAQIQVNKPAPQVVVNKP